jgi:hypothetical protein
MQGQLPSRPDAPPPPYPSELITSDGWVLYDPATGTQNAQVNTWSYVLS